MDFVKIKDLYKIKKGKKIEQIDEYVEDAIRCIQIDDLRNNDNIKYCIDNGKHVLINENDIVIAWDGANAGTIGYGLKGAIGSTLAVLTTSNKNFDTEYCGLFLKSKFKYLRDTCNGATIPHVSKTALEELGIPNIDLQSQKKISKTIKSVQVLIDKRKYQIELLDDLVKSKFIEMFGDPFINPKGWDIKCYEDICNCITDGEHSTPRRCESGIYLLSARNVLNHSLQLKDVDFIDEEEYERIAKRIVPEENDILISCSGSVGRVCKVPKDIKFQMVRSVAILKLNSNINSTFMEWLIDSNYTQKQILKSINQSSQANLFQGKIRKLKAIIPPIELQNQFEDFVKQVDKLKFNIEESLKELENNFNSLMQKAFKGELF